MLLPCSSGVFKNVNLVTVVNVLISGGLTGGIGTM